MTSSATAPKKPHHTHKPRTKANDKFNNFKVCRACNVEKRLADFNKAGNWRGKRAADPKRFKLDCKECSRAPNARDVDPNFEPLRICKPRPVKLTKKEKRAGASAYKRKMRRSTRIKALEYLASKGCETCGERDPRVLEFDHLEPCRKKYNVANLLADGYSWASEKLREEIRKCRVVCANCHRKHTIKQQEHYSHADVRAALRQIDGHYNIDSED